MAEPRENISREIILIGASGNAYDILDAIEAINQTAQVWHIAGFLDDGISPGELHCGVPILGGVRQAIQFRRENRLFINAIGSERTFRQRDELIDSTGLHSADFAIVIHPTAAVSSRATIGHGSFIGAHACIGGAVKIGNHAIICPGALVGHDASIGDFSILAPGCCISGAVDVGRLCYIGARAVIRPHVRLADQTLVGMGAVVVHGTTKPAILVGNPARPLNRTVSASN